MRPEVGFLVSRNLTLPEGNSDGPPTGDYARLFPPDTEKEKPDTGLHLSIEKLESSFFSNIRLVLRLSKNATFSHTPGTISENPTSSRIPMHRFLDLPFRFLIEKTSLIATIDIFTVYQLDHFIEHPRPNKTSALKLSQLNLLTSVFF